MRNLSVWQVGCYSGIQSIFDENLCVCYGHHEESKLENIFICTNSLIVSNVGLNREVKWKKDLKETATPMNKPVNITYMSLINTVSVGLINGELYTLNSSGTSCEVVGICDSGILAMEWSPDQEILALVTNNMNLVVMSCTFDPVNETNLLNDDFGAKQFITVGWGKKETQFHGSAGKQAAKVNNELIYDSNLIISDKIIITWRGDGNLFAVGFTMEGLRRFKVFDREGKLQYTSEKQPGIEANLSWRPSGNLIATTQKVADKHMITFFEKNGLKHGDFVLPINSDTIVEHLLWSMDSEILTAVCFDTSEHKGRILLFTSSNYHWYLKQSLVFDDIICRAMWDNDFDVVNNKKLYIFLQNGDCLCYTWVWITDHSKGKSENDNGIVSVVDGSVVKVSGFRHTVVPPPMANFEMDIGMDINSIHFAPENCDKLDSNSFLIITDENLMFMEQTSKIPVSYRIADTIPMVKNNYPFQHFNWHWVNHETFLCIKAEPANCYKIVQYRIIEGELKSFDIQELPSPVTRFHSHPTNPLAVCMLQDNGEIFEYNINTECMSFKKITIPQVCHQFGVLSAEKELYFLGLSHKGYLYLNGENVMTNVSSFFIQTSYLLITTLKHMLYCVEFTKHALTSIALYETSEIYSRKIERGAKLVVSIPNDTRTVLQMPRGNLETIQPRPLSLKIVGDYLDSLKYYEAFDLMRKQRINLNLIYDHNPKLFTENITVFLDTIKNNSWLSLFLSDLENIDVTKTMYSNSYKNAENVTGEKHKNKVEFICNLVRSHLTNATDRASRMLPMLTTYVKENTVKDLEEALTLIKGLKIQESRGEKLPVTSDEALRYLLYMVNVDHLFDVALGMYDFDLVLLVANKSQKDPKEYIPMLNELNEMDENYKKFTINKHLKRFDRAVQSLAKCGVNRHNELRTFVKYHSLYRIALSLFSVEDDIYKQIADDFGLYLKLKRQFLEAGIFYERAEHVDKAIECYKEALEWGLALRLAQNKPQEEFKKLVRELADGLKEEKRYKEAVELLEQYSEEGTEIITFAINCGQFKTALRLCSKYGNSNLIETNLLPSLIEEYSSLKDLIETNWNNFIKYRNRLKVVREIKVKKSAEEYDTYGYRDSDLYSDAGSTIASSGSGRSYRSSKNRRKHERKVASLKEGSQYEDIALVLALHNLISSSYDLRLQVKDINVALLSLNKDEEALSLQSSLEKLLNEMKESFKQIWSNEFTLEATGAVIAVEKITDGITHGVATLEPHLRIAPQVQELSWKLNGLSY